MSEFAQEWPPVWFHDLSSACALSKQAQPERRRQDFLATLSAETLRLNSQVRVAVPNPVWAFVDPAL